MLQQQVACVAAAAVVAAAAAAGAAAAAPKAACALYDIDADSFKVVPGPQHGGAVAACAEFAADDAYDHHHHHRYSKDAASASASASGAASAASAATGWNEWRVAGRRLLALSARTTAAQRDALQGRAAGVLEGYLMAEVLPDFKTNWFADMFGELAPNPQPPAAVAAWIRANDAWVRQQASSRGRMDDDGNGGDGDGRYWSRVAAVLAQLDGLAEGYALRRAELPSLPELTREDFLLLNLNGDMGDLTTALAPSAVQPPSGLDFGRKNQHCSALFVAKPDLSNILFGHTTWANFVTMTRALKSYAFDFETMPTVDMLFSGYPSILYSNDDFVLLNSSSARLTVIETTNDVLNVSAYSALTTQSVTTWIRELVANVLAESAPSWAELFAKYNSGTYNNQWMILDARLAEASIRQRRSLQPNTFYVLEQMPGFIQMGDQTQVLASEGHWASFNRPYYTEVYDRMGYKTFSEKYGNLFSYQLAPRSEIFRARAGAVGASSDPMTALQALLRYNNWKHDPLSRNLAGEAISGRFDLQEGTPAGYPKGFFAPGTHGGIDSKASDLQHFTENQIACFAQSGPTHDQQPPFNWSTTKAEWQKQPHFGQPDSWNFDWIYFKA